MRVMLLLVAYSPDLPAGAEEYTPAKWTQAIYRQDGRQIVEVVPVKRVAARWHQSGGMEGLVHTSVKYRTVPRGTVTKLGPIQVKNSLGYYQTETGVVREYPDGARFDDVLSVGGTVFEHRVREKRDGEWRSRIAYSDASARPLGYAGLKQTCASCHDESGSGDYGAGLVPGGDTVLSDPIRFSQASPSFKDYD